MTPWTFAADDDDDQHTSGVNRREKKIVHVSERKRERKRESGQVNRFIEAAFIFTHFAH